MVELKKSKQGCQRGQDRRFPLPARFSSQPDGYTIIHPQSPFMRCYQVNARNKHILLVGYCTSNGSPSSSPELLLTISRKREPLLSVYWIRPGRRIAHLCYLQK